MSIAVAETTSPRRMRRFIRLPLQLYADDPLFVPHLLMERRQFFDPRRNPLFAFTDVAYFLATDGAGRTVGRVSAHVNKRHNEFAGDRCGFFGFFECVDDPAAARALLGAAEDWLRDRGMTAVRGPLSFSTNEECGLLVEGFDRPPAFMMPYTKRYYPELLAGLGYAKARDLLAYEYDCGGVVPPYIERFAKRAAARTPVKVRPLDMGDYQADVARAFSVYNKAWERNWGFVPMTPDQFVHMAREMKPLVLPDLALIAEIDGEPVGFSLALPDLNPVLRRMKGRLLPLGFLRLLGARRRAASLRVLTMGVVKAHRRRGIEMLLIYHTFLNGIRRDCLRGEFSWVLADNVLLCRALERFGAERTKTYRIYEKEL